MTEHCSCWPLKPVSFANGPHTLRTHQARNCTYPHGPRDSCVGPVLPRFWCTCSCGWRSPVRNERRVAYALGKLHVWPG